MPVASETTTRRTALTASLAVLLAGIAAPALASGTNPDAELIALADRIIALNQEERAIYRGWQSAEDETRTEPMIAAIFDELGKIMDRIAELPPAATVDGMKALARASLVVAAKDSDEDPYFDGGDAERLALKIVSSLASSGRLA